MSLALPIPEFIGGRRKSQRPAAVRIVPEPKAYILPVAWEESAAASSPVSLHVNPESREPAHLVKTITRLRIPLELRLDPKL